MYYIYNFLNLVSIFINGSNLNKECEEKQYLSIAERMAELKNLYPSNSTDDFEKITTLKEITKKYNILAIALQKEIEDMRKRYILLEENYKNKIRILNEKNKEYELNYKETKELEDQIKLLQEENKALNKKIIKGKNRISILEDENMLVKEKFENQIKELKNEKLELDSIIINFKEKIEKLNREKNHKIKECTKLLENNERKQIFINALKIEYENKLNELEITNNLLSEENKEGRNKIIQLEILTEKLQNENNELNNNFNVFQEYCIDTTNGLKKEEKIENKLIFKF